MTIPTAPSQTAPSPAPTTPAKFAGLARSSLILGIVGIIFSTVPILDAFTMLGALVGITLGVIALFGTRKRLAGLGIGLCLFAVVCTGIAMDNSTRPTDQPTSPKPSLPAPSAPGVIPHNPPTIPYPVSPPAVPSYSPTPIAPAPDKRPVYSPPAVPSVPSYNPAPITPAPSNPVPAYYSNCDAARKAGATPLYRGQPGYRPGLDRDGDGVACE
jgi:hypothetical protein